MHEFVFLSRLHCFKQKNREFRANCFKYILFVDFVVVLLLYVWEFRAQFEQKVADLKFAKCATVPKTKFEQNVRGRYKEGKYRFVSTK